MLLRKTVRKGGMGKGRESLFIKIMSDINHFWSWLPGGGMVGVLTVKKTGKKREMIADKAGK